MSLSRIDPSIYAQRRRKLLEQLPPDSLFIIPAAEPAFRNGDSDHLYRPSSNLLYLTGFEEPSSVMVLAPGRKEGAFILFNLPNNPSQEVWTGKRVGQEGAIKEFGADQAFKTDEFAKILKSNLLTGRETIFYPLNDEHLDISILTTLRSITDKQFSFYQVGDADIFLHKMRIIKSPIEIELMQRAVDISVAAHLRAMQKCRPGRYEYELEAALMKTFYKNGSRSPAYPNIVATGENAGTLHYEKNNTPIKAGDLVLIDAAAEYDYYAADITRTFPANGKFSPQQKAAYEVVLKAQLAGIAAIKPGATFNTVSQVVARSMTQGLVQLGLLTGDLEELIRNEAYRPFYMHAPGHWIGLDTHDVRRGAQHLISQLEPFAPGMMLTIEPGLYISRTRTPEIPAVWPNMGIRIEDVVLVTNTGCHVLSAALPKTVDAIEAAMPQAKLAKEMRFYSPVSTKPEDISIEMMEAGLRLPPTMQ